jgi:Bacteroidetes-specific putative membrane protein
VQKKIIHITLFLLIIPFICKGQDVHFSVFDANPMNQNPALTAFSDNTVRFGAQYRNQWSTVSNGYNTFLLSAEACPYHSYIRREGVGLGVIFIGDAAGTLNYGSQNIGLNLSYFKCIDPMNENYISFGFQGATTSWGFDITKAIFGRDESTSYEGILLKDVRTFDFSIGVAQQFILGKENTFAYGASIFHINQPRMSFYEDDDVYLPIKYRVYAQYDIDLGQSRLKPTIFFEKQDKYYECDLGAEYAINLQDNIVSLGGYYRVFDAFFVVAKYRFSSFCACLAYDINLSRLTPASKTYGGVELSLLWGFSSLSVSHPKTSIPCPSF